MSPDRRAALLAFAVRVLAIALGLAILTAIAGIAVRAWAPGFDVQTMQAIANGRDATVTSIATLLAIPAAQAASGALLGVGEEESLVFGADGRTEDGDGDGGFF